VGLTNPFHTTLVVLIPVSGFFRLSTYRARSFCHFFQWECYYRCPVGFLTSLHLRNRSPLPFTNPLRFLPPPRSGSRPLIAFVGNEVIASPNRYVAFSSKHPIFLSVILMIPSLFRAVLRQFILKILCILAMMASIF